MARQVTKRSLTRYETIRIAKKPNITETGSVPASTPNSSICVLPMPHCYAWLPTIGESGNSHRQDGIDSTLSSKSSSNVHQREDTSDSPQSPVGAVCVRAHPCEQHEDTLVERPIATASRSVLARQPATGVALPYACGRPLLTLCAHECKKPAERQRAGTRTSKVKRACRSAARSLPNASIY